MPANEHTWSFEIRVHTCPNCGGPCEIGTGSGTAKCTYCGVNMTFAAREERLQVKAQPAANSETARLEELSGQIVSMKSHAWPPRELLRYFANDTLGSKALADEVQREWNQRRQEVERGSRGDAEIRLYWLTVAMRGLHSRKENPLLCRAMSETAAELIEESTLKARLQISIATHAVRDGDLAAAEAWLSHIDPRSSEITVHTDYALAKAVIALKTGAYADVFKYIGKAPGEIPLHLTASVHAALIRASAYECLGDTRAALDALLTLNGLPFSVFTGSKRVELNLNYYELEASCCKKSYPLYRKQAKLRKVLAWSVLLLLVVAIAALVVV